MWRKRFKDWNKEIDDMFVTAVLALEQEVLVMENYLTVHILHQYPEGLVERQRIKRRWEEGEKERGGEGEREEGGGREIGSRGNGMREGQRGRHSEGIE